MAHLLRALAAGTAAFAAMLGTGLGPAQAASVAAEMPFEAAAAAPAALLAPETPVVEPGADLPVTLMVRNTTDEAQPATEVSVAVSASSIDTRFALEAWLAGEQVLYALPVASTTVPALAPGVSYTTTLRIRGADLPWGSGEDAPPAGAYGLRLIGHQAEASLSLIHI